MEFKYLSWICTCIAVFLAIFGFFWFFAIIFGIVAFTLGILTIIYIQYGDLDKFLYSDNLEDPLFNETKTLGLNMICKKKPLVLISPNIKIQTESNRNSKKMNETRRKTLIDSGIELFFKKNSKTTGEVTAKNNFENSYDHREEKKWKPFESIRIYTDRRKSHDSRIGVDINEVPLGEESIKTEDKTKNKFLKILSGNKSIDHLLHQIIDNILRDFIDSWFCALSENKEFSEIRTRTCLEDCLQNLFTRFKRTDWVPLITTKFIDDMAEHTKLYRLATQSINNKNNEQKQTSHNLTPQKKNRRGLHKRNKSDTDVNWFFGQKLNENSKNQPLNELSLLDPEYKLLTVFFENCDLYKNECMNEDSLDRHLTNLMETVLYFTLPEEDFACLPLRTFLSTLLTNIVVKPLLNMISEPDFVNLQTTKTFTKEPPPGEFFIKLIRLCTDLSELRACRQLITKEMDLKYKESNTAELGSLRYTQKVIDLRISHLQNKDRVLNSDETWGGSFTKFDKGKNMKNIPILSLDEIFTKELAISYYLDYLSTLHLQKYVIFYLTATEWKAEVTQMYSKMNKVLGSKDETLKCIREKASIIYTEYLIPTSSNYLSLDKGLIEALSIKIHDPSITPENSWFESICKYVYEKIKNEDILLNSFYQSPSYKKLLLELDVLGQNSDDIDLSLNSNFDTASDSNSLEICLNEVDNEENEDFKNCPDIEISKPSTEPIAENTPKTLIENHLSVDGNYFKHSRSHSDCTGLFDNILVSSQSNPGSDDEKIDNFDEFDTNNESNYNFSDAKGTMEFDNKQKLSAKIINTAIHYEGRYAVYAIQVTLVEETHQKSWHIYRRYSKFLELKKNLVKRFPHLSNVPFPAKKTFKNTQRSVLEHRMIVLNEFLYEICVKSDGHPDMYRIIIDFLELDTDDKRIHGSAVIKTIETFKSGMRTIKNMPDNLVGGLSKILLGKGSIKDNPFLGVTSIPLEQQTSEYPALTSALNLLDETFDLQARSQWLRRGIINRILGAPWVSHTANKKIIHGAKSMIDHDKIEFLLSTLLNNVWPGGEHASSFVHREDNTKLRTKMAAKIALFSLLSDDLKHVLGSETSRSGLLNLFSMWQHKQLNLRIILVFLNNILSILYKTDNVLKHTES